MKIIPSFSFFFFAAATAAAFTPPVGQERLTTAALKSKSAAHNLPLSSGAFFFEYVVTDWISASSSSRSSLPPTAAKSGWLRTGRNVPGRVQEAARERAEGAQPEEVRRVRAAVLQEPEPAELPDGPRAGEERAPDARHVRQGPGRQGQDQGRGRPVHATVRAKSMKARNWQRDRNQSYNSIFCENVFLNK